MPDLNDDLRALREALALPLMSRDWYDGGCNTVHGRTADPNDPLEIAHPEPLDGTARYIAAASPDRIERVLAALEAAQRERDQARADARRLDWLEQNRHLPLGLCGAWRNPAPPAAPYWEPTTLREAIDAAMSQEGGGDGQ